MVVCFTSLHCVLISEFHCTTLREIVGTAPLLCVVFISSGVSKLCIGIIITPRDLLMKIYLFVRGSVLSSIFI